MIGALLETTKVSIKEKPFARAVYRAAQISVVILFSLSLRSQSLVAHGDVWRYRKGTTAPPVGWKTTPDASLDASWLSGPGGFGYANNTTEVSACQTLLNDMDGSYSTVAMRKSFEIATVVDPTLHLSLTMDFDD